MLVVVAAAVVRGEEDPQPFSEASASVCLVAEISVFEGKVNFLTSQQRVCIEIEY